MVSLDLERETEDILKRFQLNILKAAAISELEEEHIKSFFDNFKINPELYSIQKIGVNKVARNQAIVMIVTSFEAYIKDFFKLMVQKEDILKNALRKCEKLKVPPGKIIDIFNNKSSWSNLIIKEERLSFQNFKSLNKSYDMMGFSFEDILEDNFKKMMYNFEQKNIKVRLNNKNGSELFSNVIKMRHDIVHKSEDKEIYEHDFISFFVFFQGLSILTRSKFFNTGESIFFYRKPRE